MLAVASNDLVQAQAVLQAHEDARLDERERAAIQAVNEHDGEACPACFEPLVDEAAQCASCGLRFA